MMIHKKTHDDRRTWILRPRTLAVAVAIAVAGGLGGCKSNSANPPTPAATASQPFLYATYAGTAGYEVARVDLSTLSVVATGQTGFNAGGGSHKNYYYDGPVWAQSGGNVWGLDPKTLQVTSRAVYPSVQGDRHGTVGSGLVSTKDLSAGVAGTTVPLPQGLTSPDISRYLAQTSATPQQAATVPFCTLHHTFSATNSGMLRALSNTANPFYNIGWGTVGVEPSPDGKLTMFGVRLGDFVLFLDTDPTSPNFGKPARIIYPNFGIVKDASNAVVGTFTTPYSGTGAAAGLATGTLGNTDAGNYRWTRYSSANPSAGETYVEPCDSTMMLTPSGQSWSWEPDVDGDTLTGINVGQIDGASPGKAVYEIPIPVVKSADFFKGKHSAGPWMASLENDLIAFKDPSGATVGSPLLMSVQYEGENAEGTWNVTDPTSVYEIQRTYHNLANVIDPTDTANPTLTTVGNDTSAAAAATGYFANGTTYYVKVDYSKVTGAAATDVAYVYHALTGDDGSGVSPTNVTTGYLAKKTATDPGPQFLLNGLLVRPSSSEANVAQRTGSGAQTVSLSSEVWLNDWLGGDGLQIQNLSSSPPFLITEYHSYPTAFYGWMTPDGKYYVQIIGGKVRFIDTTTKAVAKMLSLPGAATNIAFGSYKAPVTSTSSTAAPSSSSGSGSGSGGALPPPPNPCANAG